ncbi:uncharacterized protein C4orf17 homolog [Tiliqua scincoides]|uniref:uncharacterized protein C4orf17 homolog n=1 Tax=Tiliqua scincoides TaxID=71010 RepID=UPI0034627A9C
MNINFRDHPDPQLNQRGLMTHGQYELPFGKTTYLVCRHTPHPKTVCHIKGLNDVPICVVRDRGYAPGHLGRIPGPEQNQRHLPTQAATDHPVPVNALTGQVQNPSRGKGTQLRDEISEFSKKTGNPPLLNRKDDPLRQFLEDHPQSSTAQEIQPLQAMRYRPAITDNINYTPNFLDQEVKILEKLHDILQTDSLVQIKQWLSTASLKEKEFVSNFIRSDVTSRDLLNYQQKPEDENEAEKLNLPALLKSPRGHHKGTPVEGSRSRKGERENQNPNFGESTLRAFSQQTQSSRKKPTIYCNIESQHPADVQEVS